MMDLSNSLDRRPVSRVQLTEQGRWLSLSVSIGDFIPAGQFIAVSDHLIFDVVGLDESTKDFTLSNWKGGIISGARYAFRTLKAQIQQVCVHELRGQLGASDIGVLSSAAAIAVARLLGNQTELKLNLNGWKMEETISHPQSLTARMPSAIGQISATTSPTEQEQHKAEIPTQLP